MNRRRQVTRPHAYTLSRLLWRKQLRGILLAMSLTALTLTLLGVLALRNYAEYQLHLLARSLGYTLEAAVVFRDAAAVQESLELIAAPEDLAEVRVLDSQRSLLVDWQRPATHGWSALERGLADLLLSQPLRYPIQYQGRIVGELQLSSQGSNLSRFLQNGALALLLCLAIGSLVANLYSRRTQRELMAPLRAFSAVARTIARERTFARRVPSSPIVELHELGEDFNQLLDEIEAWQNQLQRENASLAHQASHDPLTGLPNRSQFEPALTRAVRQAKLTGGRFALLFLDCNRFKAINDELGHGAGDQVLISIAERLRSQLREEDLVARLGGDEFAVLLSPLHDLEDAQRIADKILASMLPPIPLTGSSEIVASLSIGIAIYPQDASSLDELLQQADTAMYRAKRNQSGRQAASLR